MSACRRRSRLICLALATVLVAGLSACTSTIRGTNGVARSPFDRALIRLAAAPAAHFITSVGGLGSTDLEVTAGGDASGVVSMGPLKTKLMAVNGKTFEQLPAALFAGAKSDAATSMKGRWITGPKTKAGQAMLSGMTPGGFAQKLQTALNSTTDISDEPVRVNDTPALKATTTAGDIYVTSAEPYRFLRFTPKAPARLPSLPKLPKLPSNFPSSMPSIPAMPSMPSIPKLPGNNFRDAQPAADPTTSPSNGNVQQVDPQLPDVGTPPLPQNQSGLPGAEVDMEPMSPDDIADMYQNLIDQAQDLVDSIDTSYNFSLQGQASFAGCGMAGCKVTVNVENTFTSKNLQVKQINAQMHVTMTGNGAPAGECDSEAMLPVNGTAMMSCLNESPGWFAFWEQVMAAEEDGEGGTFIYTANVQVTAKGLAQADVDKITDELEERLNQSLCGQTPNSFVAGTPVLMADGSTRPIQDVGIGDRVRDFDPRTGAYEIHPVDDVIAGSGDEHLVTLTVGTGQVTATENHPFWETDEHRWVPAAELQAGDRLLTSNGATVAIRAVHSAVQERRVYNLSIDRVPTYFVRAGGRFVLVHNEKSPEQCVLDRLKVQGGRKGLNQKLGVGGKQPITQPDIDRAKRTIGETDPRIDTDSARHKVNDILNPRRDRGDLIGDLDELDAANRVARQSKPGTNVYIGVGKKAPKFDGYAVDPTPWLDSDVDVMHMDRNGKIWWTEVKHSPNLTASDSFLRQMARMRNFRRGDPSGPPRGITVDLTSDSGLNAIFRPVGNTGTSALEAMVDAGAGMRIGRHELSPEQVRGIFDVTHEKAGLDYGRLNSYSDLRKYLARDLGKKGISLP